MKKQTKITLQELVRRKEQMLEAKKKKKTQELYVASLDGTITIEEPSAALARDAQEMDAGEGDVYMTYECVIDPPLKSKVLQDAFGCREPMEIVEKIFDAGEIPQIGVACKRLAGYIDSVAPDEKHRDEIPSTKGVL